MEAAPEEPAGVYARRDAIVESVRRTTYARVSAATIGVIEDKLLAIRPSVQAHFRDELRDCQTPHFLIYRAGDFFKAHTDVVGGAAPSYIRARRVSVVIFLNDETEESAPGGFTGGTLTVYGLAGDGPFRNLGVPITGRAGMLVAFRADRLHAVTPVTHGERFAIVAWFC